MSESTTRTAIFVAVIGVVGTLGGALITNWDKIVKPAPKPTPNIAPVAVVTPASAPRTEPPPLAEPTPNIARVAVVTRAPARRTEPPRRAEPTPNIARVAVATPAPAPRTEPPPRAEPIPNIASLWRDRDYPGNGTQVSQSGTSFRFTRWGFLPNGARFESSGSGTISGQNFTSDYRARYQSGQTSVGNCSGTVSPDGLRIEQRCSDSYLGKFSVESVRQ